MLKWERGRLLAVYGDNKYSYDADGVRIKKKTANGILHKYFTEGTRIHHEEYGAHENWYYYDATGIVGIEHDGVRYYFQKNIQGDVARIFNANGYLVARYVYDAWGNHTVYDSNGNINTDENFIGNINPFRYRGYYYDIETGLYYLNTRYYDPFACRFINADDISYIEPETINGLNLYAYCLNNPIMYTDETGTMPNWLKWLIGGIAFAGAVALTVLTGGSLAPVFIGMGVSIALGGAIDGTISAVRGGSFWDGFVNGAADGAMWGGILALVGATIGAIKYALKGGQGAVAGTTKITTIKKGQMFDRFGSEYGKFITDVGTSASKLALPATNSGVKITLQATKNFRVFTGIVADGFGGTGGGVQYVLRYSIKTLLKKGWLIIV